MIEKIKETGIYFVGTIGVAVMSFIISLLYSRMFSTDSYGYYSLIAALYNLIYQLFTGWMTHSILRFYAEENKSDNVRSFKNTIFFIHIFLTAVFCILMLFIAHEYRENVLIFQMILVYMGVFLFEGLLLIFNTFLRAEGNSKQYSFNTVLNSILKSVLIILLYYIFRLRSITIIIISLLLAELFQSTYLFIKYKWHKIICMSLFSCNTAKKVLVFGYPLIGVSVIFQILTYSDRYIIQLFMTTSDVGLYSYGYNMGYSLFYTMTNAIMLGAYPSITREWNVGTRKSTEKLISNYLNLYMYLMIPATLGVLAVGDKIIQVMCGKEYWNASGVFIVTCISYFLNGLLQYTNKAWELTQKTKMILKLNVVAAIANITLNIIFIPKCGYIVAAVTTMVSFILYIALSLFLSKKILIFKIDNIVLRNVAIAGGMMLLIAKVLDSILSKSFVLLIMEILLSSIVYIMMLLFLKDKNMLALLKKIFKF